MRAIALSFIVAGALFTASCKKEEQPLINSVFGTWKIIADEVFDDTLSYQIDKMVKLHRYDSCTRDVLYIFNPLKEHFRKYENAKCNFPAGNTFFTGTYSYVEKNKWIRILSSDSIKHQTIKLVQVTDSLLILDIRSPASRLYEENGTYKDGWLFLKLKRIK